VRATASASCCCAAAWSSKGPGETWSRHHLAWLSKVRFEQPLAEVVFGEHLAHHEVLLAVSASIA
jgi:hypothetical protein